MHSCSKPTPMSDLVQCQDGTLQFVASKFVEYFPEFKDLATGVVQIFGEMSVAYFDVCAFGRMYGVAVGLLTAHRLATTYDMGPVYAAEGMRDLGSTEVGTNISASTSSMSEGSQPLSLATGENAFDADLARTGYGLLLLGLIRTWIAAGDLVAGGQLGWRLSTEQWPPPDAGY